MRKALEALPRRLPTGWRWRPGCSAQSTVRFRSPWREPSPPRNHLRACRTSWSRPGTPRRPRPARPPLRPLRADRRRVVADAGRSVPSLPIAAGRGGAPPGAVRRQLSQWAGRWVQWLPGSRRVAQLGVPGSHRLRSLRHLRWLRPHGRRLCPHLRHLQPLRPHHQRRRRVTTPSCARRPVRDVRSQAAWSAAAPAPGLAA